MESLIVKMTKIIGSFLVFILLVACDSNKNDSKDTSVDQISNPIAEIDAQESEFDKELKLLVDGAKKANEWDKQQSEIELLGTSHPVLLAVKENVKDGEQALNSISDNLELYEAASDFARNTRKINDIDVVQAFAEAVAEKDKRYFVLYQISYLFHVSDLAMVIR
jgi:hypothetical protein